MISSIRYADLWALLRKLGFNCETIDEGNHRICEFAPTETRIVLHDYPADRPVREEILIAVGLQLDNGGVMSRANFDRWAERRTKTGAANNGRGQAQKARKRVSRPG
jgi:hypothetical protein